MDTPIERLRAYHRPWTSSEKQTYCQACQLGFAKWPCDTIAALDALQARLDAATKLLNEALWLIGGEGPYQDDVREWLAGAEG